MDLADHVPPTGVGDGPIAAVALVAAVAAGVAVAAAGATPEPSGYELAVSLLVGSAVADREGLGALLAWIVGGVVLGAGAGYAVNAVVDLPLTAYGTAGMGAALGGGVGSLVNFLSVGEAEREPEPGLTVDMGPGDDPEPRPADLFEDHPDPVLYVADVGGGPVVRAANDAYGETFDLPTTTLADAPLSDALRPADGDEGIVDALGAGEPVDRDLRLRTADGTAPFHVRSVGDPADGYLLFTRVDGR